MRNAGENRARRGVEIVERGTVDETGLTGGGAERVVDGRKSCPYLPSEIVARPSLAGCDVVAVQDVTKDGVRVVHRGHPVPWGFAVEVGWVPDLPVDQPVTSPSGMHVTTPEQVENMVAAIRDHHQPGTVSTGGDVVTAVAEIWGVRYTFTADLSGLQPVESLEEYLGANGLTVSKGGTLARQLTSRVTAEIERRHREARDG
jgi:hypothetical protein